MDLANRNGLFLSKLNTETGVTNYKSIRSKHRMKKAREAKKAKESQGKKGVGSAIQTFFTDLFPLAPSNKK